MKLQERFLECNLRVYIIDWRVSEEKCYDIFDRVNSGEPLTKQQMRNCLCNGKGTRFLKNAATEKIFKDATGESLKPKIMEDCEWINRFCAFQIYSLEYYEKIPRNRRTDEFLSSSLKKMNSMEEDELDGLLQKFRQSLKNNYELFGAHAFRKSFLEHGSGTRSQRGRTGLVQPLWDVMITELSEYSVENVLSKKEPLRKEYRNLLRDPRFIDSIDKVSHTPRMIKIRFDMVRKKLGHILERRVT